jgi:predicted porin
MFAKKTLVAVAALLAAAGAAQAESSVKLYGYVEGTFGSYENYNFDSGLVERTTEVGSGNMMTSFIGLSGSEDLGGGLKAEFVLESFLANDTGSTLTNMAGGFWGRGSWVGLSGDFGRVAVGQYDNAFFTMGLLYNSFGSSMVFSPTMVSYYGLSGAVFGTGSLATLSYDTGWVNSITYETPNIAGFTASLQYSPKETTAGGDTKDNYAVSAAYNAGKFSAMAVYTVSGENNDAFLYRQKNFGLGASYDFGVATVSAQYSQMKDDYASYDYKATFYQVGASIPVTDVSKVMVSYGHTKYDDFGKLKQFSVGYDYSLSKRTGVYAALTTKKLSDYGMIDETATSYAVGLRHAF